MKVEIVKNIKTSKLWKKGLIFNSDQAPIPSDILKEVKQGSDAVKVIPDLIAEAEKLIAEAEMENELQQDWLDEMEDSETEPEPPKPNKAQGFQCHICEWTGKTLPALKRHITIAHR